MLKSMVSVLGAWLLGIALVLSCQISAQTGTAGRSDEGRGSGGGDFDQKSISSLIDGLCASIKLGAKIDSSFPRIHDDQGFDHLFRAACLKSKSAIVAHSSLVSLNKRSTNPILLESSDVSEILSTEVNQNSIYILIPFGFGSLAIGKFTNQPYSFFKGLQRLREVVDEGEKSGNFYYLIEVKSDLKQR